MQKILCFTWKKTYIFQFQVELAMQDNKSQPLRSDELLSCRVVHRLSDHNLPQSLLGLQST